MLRLDAGLQVRSRVVTKEGRRPGDRRAGTLQKEMRGRDATPELLYQLTETQDAGARCRRKVCARCACRAGASVCVGLSGRAVLAGGTRCRQTSTAQRTHDCHRSYGARLGLGDAVAVAVGRPARPPMRTPLPAGHRARPGVREHGRRENGAGTGTGHAAPDTRHRAPDTGHGGCAVCGVRRAVCGMRCVACGVPGEDRKRWCATVNSGALAAPWRMRRCSSWLSACGLRFWRSAPAARRRRTPR